MELNKDTFAGLKLIFFALLIGQLLFVAVVIFLLTERVDEPTYVLGESTDLPATAAYVIGMIFLSRFIDNMWVRQIPTVLRVQRSAFAHYRTNVIIRLAILEGASLLTIVFTMVTGNPMLLIATAIAIAAFWMAKPSPEEFQERYEQPL